MKKYLPRTIIFGCLFVLTGLFLAAPAMAVRIDKGSVAGVWSCWYWDWVDDEDPSLFDNGDAMNRYDILVSDDTYTSYAQWWEYQYHGPPQNPDKWWGHCHAWAGAACWERQPSKYKVVKNAATGVKVKFRVRDRKGLMCEAYYNDASSNVADFMISQPSPGVTWSALRQEIRGIGAMWGKKRGFVGELYYGPEVWNYPIFQYKVTCWRDSSGYYYGYMTLWGLATVTRHMPIALTYTALGLPINFREYSLTAMDGLSLTASGLALAPSRGPMPSGVHSIPQLGTPTWETPISMIRIWM